MSETEVVKPKILEKKKRKPSQYKYIKVYLLPEDLERLHTAAKESEMSASKYVREQLNFTMPEKREFNTDIEKKMILIEFKRIGNNLNQLTKRANQKKEVDLYIAEKINQIRLEIKRIGGRYDS